MKKSDGIDWEQEQRISDWEADQTWRPERGSKQQTWRIYLWKRTVPSVLRDKMHTGLCGAPSRQPANSMRNRPRPKRDLELVPLSDVMLVTQETPEIGVQRREEADRLWACVDRLPERDALILRLYYLDELYMEEIGHRVGLSEARVSQLLERATRRLHPLLGAR